MNKEQAKQLLPIITAFSEGKGIEIYTGLEWIPLETPDFTQDPTKYRIQERPWYRPYLWHDGVVYNCTSKDNGLTEAYFEKQAGFRGWLNTRVYYDTTAKTKIQACRDAMLKAGEIED